MKTPNKSKPARSSIRRLALALAMGLGLGGGSARADYSSTVAGFNPLGYWQLNETASSVPDNTAYSIGTGTGINGTYTGTVTKGVLGALTTESTYNPTTVAASVAGAGRVAIPYDANLNTQVFTAEVWVKPAVLVATNGANAVFSSGQPAASARTGWVLYQFGNGTNNQFSFRAFTKNSNVTTNGDANGLIAGPVLAADTWYHVAIQVDEGGVSRLFVNGTEAGNTSTAAYAAATPANIAGSGQDAGTTIGARYLNGGSSANPFNGVLDEVAFYSSALSAAEILAHYENGMNSPARTQAYQELVAASSPVGYYRLDEDPFVPPTAVNSGSLLSAADGTYSVGTITNQAGPPLAGLGAGNTACRFDGSGQIPCGSDTGFDVTEISVAAWIKASSVSQNMTVIAKGSSLWCLQIDGFTNHLKWVCPGITDGAITGTVNVIDGLWHHVVAVAGASGSALYVDGVLDVSDATAVDLTGNISGDPVTLGSQGASTARWLGTIDEAAVFGAALTETDVVALYQAAAPPANDIYSFGPGAVISDTNITWTVPYGTDLTTLAPTYTASSFATGSPLSGSTQDFSDSVNNPVPYTITAPDTSTKTYLVTVILGKIPVPTGMVCWYDAGVGVTTSGSKVTKWEDQSGNGHHASGGGGTVTLAANQLAGKPGLQFRSSWLNVPGAMFTKEQYLVMKSPGSTWTNNSGFFGPTDPTFTGAAPGGQDWRYWRVYNMRGGDISFWPDPAPDAVSKNGTPVAPQWGDNFVYPVPPVDQYMILKIDVNTTTYGGAKSPANYQIGKVADTGTIDFDVVEIIAYDTLLSAADEAKLGSYLAQKYMIASAYPIYYLAVTMASPAANEEFQYGMPVTATATVVEPGTATDTVKFYTKLLPAGSLVEWSATDSGSGLFSADLGVMASGTYELYATATNDASPPESATSLTQTFTVAPATSTITTLDTSGSPSTYGQSVTFTATVVPTPSGGTVQFYDNGSAIGSPVAVNTGTGQAQVSTTLLGVDGGTAHAITAEYNGYGIYLGSTADPLPQTVDKALLTVSADNKIRIPGTANPTLTATITGYKNGEDHTTAGVNNEPLLACAALPGDPEGTYPITCDASPMTAANYSFTGAGGILTVIAGAVPVSNGLVCWYDAGNGVTEDGSGVTTWNDLSGNSHHATRGSGTVTLVPGDVNSRPAVHLRGGNTYLNCAPLSGMFNREQYVVVRSPNDNWSGTGSFLGRASNDFLSVRSSSYNMQGGTTGFWQDHYPQAVSKNGTPVEQAASSGVGFRAIAPITDYMILKITVDNSASAANIAAYPNYQIGKNETLGTMDFDVAEIIAYENALSPEEEAMVGSYLSTKYDLTTAYPLPGQMISFGLPGNQATINQATHEIAWTVPYGTPGWPNLAPEYTLTSGSCVPASASSQDFSGPVTYTVTDTTTDPVTENLYTVTVTVGAPPILFGATGTGSLAFDTQPPATEWSGYSIPGGGADASDVASLGAVVNTVAASTFTTLPEITADPTGTEATAGAWNSAAVRLTSRATGNAATAIMATLYNNSGSAINEMDLSFTLSGGGTDSQLPGYVLYYSLTGDAGSWQPIGEFGTLGAVTASNIALTSPWADGSTMYVLWVDDNADGVGDTWYGIDDVDFAPSGTGGGYAAWAATHAGGQAANLDYNNDGIANGIAYFMGATGLATNPGVDGTNTVTWPKDPAYNGTWQVQTSPDLGAWTDVAGTDNGTSVSYTLPAGAGKLFVRLVVTPN